jgi:EAL domain-containing protein (putative c-di-GMP-specific phosphodiesterase class I)
MDEEREARQRMETQLRRVVAMRELDLVYQPQMNLASGKITGFEALLRWNSPVCGQVSPGAFIPLAESLGLIGKIGDWVLRAACREAMKWPPGLRVAVNVSAAQFGGDALPMSVMTALAESGLPANRLDLEVTESVLLDDNRKPLPTLHRLRDLGVQISMDDFGTGYSSLSYLLSFPFERLKIDQSFVRARGDRAVTCAVLEAIASMGSALGMTTTAEGVETAAQLDAVRAAGCTDMQGYYLSPPIAAERICEFLRGRQTTEAQSREVA